MKITLVQEHSSLGYIWGFTFALGGSCMDGGEMMVISGHNDDGGGGGRGGDDKWLQ